MKHRVAITGLGIISSIGSDADSVAKALYQGKSGIYVDNERLRRGFLSPLAGRIQNFTSRFPLSRKQRKTLPEYGIWAVEAAYQAIQSAGLSPQDLGNEESGVIFGNDSSTLSALEQVGVVNETGGTSSIGSGVVFQSMTSCISMNLNVLFGTKGAAWSVSGACASGGHAVGQAADLIRMGRQERMLCGGAQEINWESMCSFDSLGVFSTRIDDPASACRPFDASRDGLVPGGGAAALLLERYDLAQKRGAVILGEIAGYGFSSDGETLAVPSETGLYRAMRMAMREAGVTCDDISYICAHATATPTGNAREAGNILALFEDRAVPVSSTKSMTGHELWMSGAAQVVYTTLMARNGFIAPNRNFTEGDGVCSRLAVVREAIQTPPKTALCNAAGFGGTNSCLVLSFT